MPGRPSPGPASYDVSAAASMVVALTSDPTVPDAESRAALAVFGCLTDISPDSPAGADDVLRLAVVLSEDDVTAYPPTL